MTTSSILSCVVQFQSGAPRHCSHRKGLKGACASNRGQGVLQQMGILDRWSSEITKENNHILLKGPCLLFGFTRASISSFYFGITIASCCRSFHHWTPKWQRFGTGFKVHWTTHYFEFHAYSNCLFKILGNVKPEFAIYLASNCRERTLKRGVDQSTSM